MASINENTARYVDAVRNAPKPWDPRPATDAQVEPIEDQPSRKRVYLISPRDAFSEQLDGGPPEIVEDLRETVPWRAEFPLRYALTTGDETTLVKVSFLMEIVEMAMVAEFIAEAVGARIELTEAFFDKYWITEGFDEDNDVWDAIVAYARHPRFPELRSSVNETIADFIDGVIEKGPGRG